MQEAWKASNSKETSPQHKKIHVRFHQVHIRIFHFENNGNFDRSLSLKGDENFPHETVCSIIVNNNVAFNSTERNIISNIHSSNYGFESLGYLYIWPAKECAIKWNICQNITWRRERGKKYQFTIQWMNGLSPQRKAMNKLHWGGFHEKSTHSHTCVYLYWLYAVVASDLSNSINTDSDSMNKYLICKNSVQTEIKICRINARNC